MPRVKGTPTQKETSLTTVFARISPDTAGAVTKPDSVSGESTALTPRVNPLTRLSKAVDSGESSTLPKKDADTKHPCCLQECENSAPSPPQSFFLPERVASQPVRERETVVCSVCQKSMLRDSLREHMDRHENSGKFECELCGKNFSRASAREKHIRTHTGERPFKCDLCAKAYRQKVHLNEHMRSHSGDRPFVCRLCGFSLASKSLLNRHLRTHGVRNGANDAPNMWLRTDAPKSQVLAAAEAVGRSINAEKRGNVGLEEEEEDPDTLHVTVLNATATVAALGRKHLCPECPAGFPTIQALRSHRVTTHGLVVKHVCETCGAAFSSKKALKIHLRSNHPQVCPLCEQVMPQRRRWVLEVHIRENHPGVSADKVLGPSPLATAIASGGRKRRGSRRQRTAPKRCRLSPKIQRNGDDTVNHTKDDASIKEYRGGSAVTCSDCVSHDGDGVNVPSTVSKHCEASRDDGGRCDSPSAFFKLYFEPITRQSNQNVVSVTNADVNSNGNDT